MAKVSVPATLLQGNLTPQEAVMEMSPRSGSLFIGIPKEHSPLENRVALTPASVGTLVAAGHRIVVEAGAGEGAFFSDLEYSEAGAAIVHDTQQAYEAAIVLKVSPVVESEIAYLRPDQVLLSPIHVPALSPDVIQRLRMRRVLAIAVDYIKDTSGAFPVVRSMSEIAGMSAMLTAAELLTNVSTGRGVLLGGISGVPSAKVVILGAGMVAQSATRAALGLGAEVRIFDNNIYKLMRLQQNLGRQLHTSTLNSSVLEQELRTADVVVGALHSHTGRAPIVVSEMMVMKMKQGAVLIDVSIDQGGCFATSEMTTHAAPTFQFHGITHYCVPNIASRVAQTASTAMSNILTPLLQQTADAGGFEAALSMNKGLQNGVVTYKGCLTHRYIAERFGMKYTDLPLLLVPNW